MRNELLIDLLALCGLALIGVGVWLSWGLAATLIYAGSALLVREFDDSSTTTSLAADRVDGTFLVGGHTMFINPSNSGSDSFIGTVVLSTNGGFRLDALGNQGIDFSYVGEWTSQANGKLTFTVNGTNETWHGAIDRSYNTLVIVDDFVETRSNNVPELNLLLGVRKKLD